MMFVETAIGLGFGGFSVSIFQVKKVPLDKTPNGLLLSPTFDKMFDRGFISFKNDGTIKLSYHFSERNFKILGLEDGIKYPIKPDGEMKLFLEYHRETIFMK